jgi:hypothetical protein
MSKISGDIKYVLLRDKTLTIGNRTLYQIQAVKNFKDVMDGISAGILSHLVISARAETVGSTNLQQSLITL